MWIQVVNVKRSIADIFMVSVTQLYITLPTHQLHHADESHSPIMLHLQQIFLTKTISFMMMEAQSLSSLMALPLHSIFPILKDGRQ